MVIEPGTRRSDTKSPRFFEFAWQSFDPLVAIDALLKSDESFFAEKQIIFCALSAWIVDPSNDELRKLAISRQIALQLISLESDRSTKYDSQLGDVVRHIQHLAEPEIAAFYREIYYPVGGLKTIISGSPSSRFHTEMQKASGGVNTAVRVAAIYHYHAANFADKGEFYLASLSKAAKLIGELESKPQRGEGGANVDNIKKQWLKCRTAISLAYAASEINVKDQRYSDLLDVMQKGRISWEKHGSLLPKLLDRGFYVEQQVFSEIYKNESLPFPFSIITNVFERAFKPRDFSEADKKKAFVVFSRKPGVKESP